MGSGGGAACIRRFTRNCCMHGWTQPGIWSGLLTTKFIGLSCMRGDKNTYLQIGIWWGIGGESGGIGRDGWAFWFDVVMVLGRGDLFVIAPKPYHVLSLWDSWMDGCLCQRRYEERYGLQQACRQVFSIDSISCRRQMRWDEWCCCETFPFLLLRRTALASRMWVRSLRLEKESSI